MTQQIIAQLADIIDDVMQQAGGTTLREKAHALAIAQLAAIHDGHTWYEAYAELMTLDDDASPISFTPYHPYEHATLDEFAQKVEEEADTIHIFLLDAAHHHAAEPQP